VADLGPFPAKQNIFSITARPEADATPHCRRQHRPGLRRDKAENPTLHLRFRQKNQKKQKLLKLIN
jgi:hypothetical protein